jgi:hypothetical protein
MIPANLTRSRRGCYESSARASTRRAKLSQLNSQLIRAAGESGVTDAGSDISALLRVIAPAWP